MPSQDDIDTLKKLLAAHRQTLGTLLEQQALLGFAHAPPGIVNSIREARDEIQRIKGSLRDWNEVIEDLLIDVPADQQSSYQDSQAAAARANDPKIERTAFTGGGDYAEGDIDARQGVFLDGSTTQDSVIVGINQGTINTSVQFEQRPLLASLGELTKLLEQVLPQLLPNATQTQGPQLVAVTSLPPIDRAPLVPELYISRDSLIQQLEQKLSSCTWLALVDSSGKGKTQIVRDLLGRRVTEHTWWISLRDNDPIASHFDLEKKFARWLTQLTGDSAVWRQHTDGYISFYDITERIAQIVGSLGIVVIDDLPDPVRSQSLYDGLCLVTSIFANYNTKLLTTSQRRPPPFVALQIGPKGIVTQIPPLSSDDILGLLEQAQAPKHIRHESIVSLILADTKGLPLLVGAYVLWLKQRDWPLLEEGFAALLSGSPGEPVREFARRQMIQLLAAQSREVLYRLSLIQFEFDKPLAMKVAAVEPIIERIGEFIDDLAGSWLELKQDAKYEISPLLKHAGQHALDFELQRKIHHAIADHLISHRVIDVSQAHKLITHLWQSRDYDRFVSILARVLLEAHTQVQAKQVRWMTHILTASGPWPDDMGLNLRIILRAAQIHARVIAGENATDLDDELEVLLAQAKPEHAAAIFFACLTTGPMLEGMPPLISLRRTIRALRIHREYHLIPDDVLPSTIDEIIVFPLVHIKTPEQLRQVLVEFQEMTEAERRSFFATELAVEIIPALIDTATWSFEADKEPSERHWEEVFALLDAVQAVGELPGAEPFLIAQARARAVTLAEYQENVGTAIAILEQAPLVPQEPLAFLIHYTVGCILFDANRSAEALEWFDTAPVISHDIFAYYNFDTKRRQAIIRERQEQWDFARRQCIEAIRAATFHMKYFAYDRFEMLGELAWIHWAAGNQRKTFAALYGLVVGLVAYGDETNPRYREVFNKVGHGLGWFLSMSTLGEPPPATLLGNEYVPVHPGFYALRRQAMSEHTPKFGFSKTVLLAQFGLLLSKNGLYRTAFHVYGLAVTYAQDDSHYWLLGIGDIDYAGLTARLGQFEQALSLGLRAIKLFVATQRSHDDSQQFLVPRLDSQNAWKALTTEERRREERKLLYIVFGPIYADILGEQLGQAEALARIAVWEEVLARQIQTVEDPAFWRNVVTYMKALVTDQAGGTPSEEALMVRKEDPLLQALWYLVVSTHKDISLTDALRLQVYTLDYLIQSMGISTHMLPGVGRFIHHFWSNVAHQQSFALRSPQLFRTDLLQISPGNGILSAIQTLRRVAQALGVRLADTFIERFKQAERTMV